MVIHFIRNARRRQNVEGEILRLCARNARMAVDPTQTQAHRNVRDESSSWSDEVITRTEVEPEIMIFDAAKNGLSHRADIKLIVAAEPTVCVYSAPPHPRGQKLRADLVAVWIAENSEQISGFDRHLDPRQIKHTGAFTCDFRAGKRSQRCCKKNGNYSNRQKFHRAALR